ncbi:Abi family protein [Kitasatospora sp. NPDC101235]|uniref:Abi family protein n=1 Tax=Kitasatospora sp. NPDC101235 TaxID=3364101 RepID=UPI00381E9A4A
MHVQPTPQQLGPLTELVSGPRLAPYLAQTSTKQQAMALYLWNIQVTGACAETIALAEVVLRNAMSDQLAAAYGPQWYTKAELFDDRTVKDIRSAWNGISLAKDPATGRPLDKTVANVPAGKVVANTMLGCWINLLDRGGTRGEGPMKKRVDYDSTLWRKALYRAFPHSNGKRATVHETASRMRALRNRAAHHEPLIDGVPLPGQGLPGGGIRRLTLAQAHQEVLDLVGFIDRDVADWLGKASRVPQLLSVRP